MKTFLDKSQEDIRVIQALYPLFFSDEGVASIICYHTQQAIEKLLKHMLEMRGHVISIKLKTHSLSVLAEALIMDGVELPERFLRAAFLISGWEADSRYPGNFKAVHRDVEEALGMYNELLEIYKAISPPTISTDSTVNDTLKSAD